MSGPDHQATPESTTTGPESPEGLAATVDEPRRAALGRAAGLITAGNLISRITGFIRVIAVAGALGIAFLGDAYQRANEVSNVLFELLIGGLLFSILVPSFVELLGGNRTQGASDRESAGNEAARHLGSVLATRGVAIVGVIALIGMFGGTWIMRVLTIGVPEAVRDDQIRLGAFLLWFIMPQLVFYAAGAVASALLQADHRFLATSIAPVFNNIAVTVTMVVFAAEHDPSRGLMLTEGEKVLLGAGTLAGTVAMTIVPFVALWHAGLRLQPRWRNRGTGLSTLVRRGAWAMGHVGLNEVLILVTIVLAGRVDGGVIAYQTAFMFFLLPHALVAYPIFTALYPRLSRRASALDRDAFASDLRLGMRSMLLLLIPASGVLAIVAAPALSVLRIGRLDAAGTRMVALVLAGYLAGLCAYSLFFLLTRASYALGDARSPTLVNVGVTAVSVAAMIVVTDFVRGTSLLVSFGVIQAVLLVAGVIVLYRIVARWAQVDMHVLGALSHAIGAAIPSLGCALVVANLIGWSTRAHAVGAGVAAGSVALVGYAALLLVFGNPEAIEVRARLGARLRRAA